MIASPLLAAGLVMTIVAVLFVICSVALILIVLIQKGRGGGLSGAFGGAMASGILGSKTGDFLTWVTIALAGFFLLMAAILQKFYKPGGLRYGSDQVSGQVAPSTQGQAAPSESIEGTPSDGGIDAGTDGQPASAQPDNNEPATQEGDIQTTTTDDANNRGDTEIPGG